MITLGFLKDFIEGIAIGSGAILPGISSGVICVIFGIYENLLNCVLNFFKNVKQNFKFLFPIVLGIFFGIIIFGNLLKYIFYAYPIQTKFIFIGLILGNVPTLFKEACSKNKFKPHYLIYMLITFAIGVGLVFLENTLSSTTSATEYSYFYLILCGFLMSAGVIIPGVSSTLILMLLGVYDAYLVSVSSIYLPLLIPMGIGLILGSIICMKLIKFLLDKISILSLCLGLCISSLF